MSILEQHFYTDAGVNLRENSINKVEKNGRKIYKSKMPRLDTKVELKNATDDAKANLQKINKEVVRLKISKSDSVINESCKMNKNKRHSIVFHASDSDRQQKKMLNRRSLSEIPTREMSRIPVSFKSFAKSVDLPDFARIKKETTVNTTQNTHTEIGKCRLDNFVVKKTTGSCIPCIRNNLNNCNKENPQKTTSGLPVLMK